jgi:hypothetical protein
MNLIKGTLSQVNMDTMKEEHDSEREVLPVFTLVNIKTEPETDMIEVSSNFYGLFFFTILIIIMSRPEFGIELVVHWICIQQPKFTITDKHNI